MAFLDTVILRNTVETWALALTAGLATLFILPVIQRYAAKRLAEFAKRTETQWDDILAEVLLKTRRLFLSIIALYVAAGFLTLPPRMAAGIRIVTIVALLVQAGLWLSAAMTAVIENYRRRRLADDRAAATTVGALGFIARLALWTVILLLTLDNVGVDITALIAGLGIGGIAIALALQNILGDLFSSLSIVLDKPFVIGDFLIVDDFLGTVEHVGLKSTRVRSLTGEQVVFANTDLLRARVRNFGRMAERRITFEVGVTYQTPREKLQEIPRIIKAAVEAQPQTRFDRSHFASYGDFALTFETAYYMLKPDFNLYMDTQQAINLHIHEAFEREGIEFAYPTQTLFMVKQEA